MTIKEYLTIAKQYDKSNKTIIGYELEDNIYITIVDTIPVDRVYLKKMSRNGYCLALRLNLKTKLSYLNNAIKLCGVNEFKGGYNKGDTLEKLVRELHDLPHRHDNLAFYEGCDMVVNGVGYSIKWEHSQLYAINTLDRLVNN